MVEVRTLRLRWIGLIAGFLGWLWIGDEAFGDTALPGSGTEEDPWRIESLTDFDEFAADPNYWSDYTRLETDVNLSGRTYTTAVIAPDTDSSRDWFQGVRFIGVFDGNDHEITGLSIDDGGAGNDFLGLFGHIHSGEVKNLSVGGYSISGDYYVGGLAGESSFSDVLDCYCAGDVSGNRYVGGLVGRNLDGDSLNCCFTGDVSGDWYVGGLVGLIGDTNIVDCFVEDGSVLGTRYVGGLVGRAANGIISSCYTNTSVIGDQNVGGLVGYLSIKQSMLEDFGVVMNCYSVGQVSGNSDTGGLIGYCSTPLDVRDCYWDIDISGQSTSAGGSARQNAEMRRIETFAAWACEVAWKIDDGVDYPRLLWEDGPGQVIEVPFFFPGYGGSERYPHLIENVEELYWLSAIPCIWNRYFRLTADLDMEEVDDLRFRPIGGGPAGSGLPGFSGMLDGDGHRINGFSYYAPDSDNVGLFGRLSYGEIKNLALVKPDVNAPNGDSVGALAGTLNRSDITNCRIIHGRVSGGDNVGGLAGKLQGYCWITNCRFHGTVSGINYVGGLFGADYSQAHIDKSSSSGTVFGQDNVGGLIGYHGGHHAVVYTSYSRADVWGDEYVGGLFGSTGVNRASGIDCYARGNVTGNSYVGGLAGYVRRESYMYRSYSTGKIVGSANAGGLVGALEERASAPKCFWDKYTSGRRASAGGTGLATKYMKRQSTYVEADWDFEVPIWTIDEGVDYPRLWWEVRTDPWTLRFAGFNVVEKTRVDRTVFKYVLSLSVTNLTHTDVTEVNVKLVSTAWLNTRILDRSISFPVVEAYSTIDSNSLGDHFVVEVDRSRLIAPKVLTWELDYTKENDSLTQMVSASLPLEPMITGDLTDEGTVNFEDLAELAGQWLWTGAEGGVAGDIVEDGAVNLADFAELAENWQR